jgi:hypothetical protein
MAQVTRSPNALLNPAPLLKLLGIHFESDALPQLLHCPRCQRGTLQLLRDPVAGGGWFRCRRCDRAGDLLSLAEWVWDTDLPTAWQRLVAHGLLPGDSGHLMAAYLRDHREPAARLQECWEKAQKWLQSGDARVGKTLSAIGYQFEGWRDSSRGLIGALPRERVEAAFFPATMNLEEQERRQRYNPSAQRLFSGKGWKDVLVAPFYDLPGRVSALLCMGRQGRETDFVFRTANRGHSHDPMAEAGLHFAPGALERAAAFGQGVLAIGDVRTSLRFQFKFRRDSDFSPRIVTWIDTAGYPEWSTTGRRARTQAAWQMLSGMDLVFWMPRWSVLVLRQAIETGGKITSRGPVRFDDASMSQYLWRFPLEIREEELLKAGVPWPEFLNRHFVRRPDTELAQLLVDLQAEGIAPSVLLRAVGRQLRDRIEQILDRQERSRSIVLGRQTIVEREGQWWTLATRKNPSELVSSSAFRIDRMGLHPHTGTPVVQGRVFSTGRKLPFQSRLQDLERNGPEWLRGQLLSAGEPAPEVGTVSGKQLVRIATAFSPPLGGHPVAEFGWDENRETLTLPAFRVRCGGDIAPVEWALTDPESAGIELPYPRPWQRAELESFAEECSRATDLWPLVTWCLTQTLAPAWQQPIQGLACVGNEQLIQRVLAACGARTVTLRKATDLQRLQREEERLEGPVLVLEGTGLTRSQQRQSSRLPQSGCPIARACSAELAYELDLTGGWEVCASAAACGSLSESFLEGLRHLASTFLSHVISRNLRQLREAEKGPEFGERVRGQIQAYLKAQARELGLDTSASRNLVPRQLRPSPRERLIRLLRHSQGCPVTWAK